MSIRMIWHLFSLSTARTLDYQYFVLERKINLQLEDIFGICLKFSHSLALLVSSTADVTWQIRQLTEVCGHAAPLCKLPAPPLTEVGHLAGPEDEVQQFLPFGQI